MHVQLRHPQDLRRLCRRICSERKATQKDRYRVVLMALQGQNLQAIMGAVGRSRSFVQHSVYAYRDGGLSALPRAHQADRQEERAEESIVAHSPETDAAYRARAIEALRVLEEKYGCTFPGVDDVLRRLTPAISSPRAAHRRNGPQRM